MITLWFMLNRKIMDVLDHGTILGQLLTMVTLACCGATIIYACAFMLVYGTYLLLR